jgi:hypothetical protein
MRHRRRGVEQCVNPGPGELSDGLRLADGDGRQPPSAERATVLETARRLVEEALGDWRVPRTSPSRLPTRESRSLSWISAEWK